MARRSITIDEKIEKQKEITFALKNKYEAAVAKLDDLIQKKKAMQKDELIKAIENSDKSIEEIMAFVTEKSESGD